MKLSNCVTEHSFFAFCWDTGWTAGPPTQGGIACVTTLQRTGLLPGVTKQGHGLASSPVKAKSKAKCELVLVSRALIMKLEEKLPWAPTTWQRERVGTGGEGAKCSGATEETKQLVFHLCCRQKLNLYLPISLLSRIKCKVRRMKAL